MTISIHKDEVMWDTKQGIFMTGHQIKTHHSHYIIKITNSDHKILYKLDDRNLQKMNSYHPVLNGSIYHLLNHKHVNIMIPVYNHKVATNHPVLVVNHIHPTELTVYITNIQNITNRLRTNDIDYESLNYKKELIIDGYNTKNNDGIYIRYKVDKHQDLDIDIAETFRYQPKPPWLQPNWLKASPINDIFRVYKYNEYFIKDGKNRWYHIKGDMPHTGFDLRRIFTRGEYIGSGCVSTKEGFILTKIIDNGMMIINAWLLNDELHNPSVKELIQSSYTFFNNPPEIIFNDC